MADVWLAHARGAAGFEKSLVIKTLLPTLAQDARCTEMFLNEAHLAAKLNHPNCVQIFDLGHEGGDYYIAMEFIDGVPLTQVLRRVAKGKQWTPIELSARIAMDAASGLEYAHRLTDREGRPLHLIHRDVSLDNILVSFEGQVKIVDFGIAKITQPEGLTTGTQLGQVKGKIGYMAPEYLRGEPIDARADLFALGVVLYTSLTHRKPFRGSTDALVTKAVLDEQPRPPQEFNPAVPDPLAQVVLKALSKEPGERYPSARAMRTAIEQAVKQPAGTEDVAAFLASLWPPTDEEREHVRAMLRGEAPVGATIAFGRPGSQSVDLSLPRTGQLATGLPHLGWRRKSALLGGAAVALCLIAGAVLLRPGPPAAREPPDAPKVASPAADAAVALAVAPTPAPAPDAAVAAQAPAPGPVASGEPGDAGAAQVVAVADAGAPPDQKKQVVATGKVEVISSPPVDIQWRGKLLGRAPRTVVLPAGRQTLRLVNRALGLSREEAVSVAAGETGRVQVTFSKAYLDVRASPWAEVRLNGVVLGTTPLPEQELYEGTHLLDLSNPETGKARQLKIRLAPGEHKVVRESMR